MKSEAALAKIERVEAWMKGKEPTIDPTNYKLSLIKLFNYHNEFTDLKDVKKKALKYFKASDSIYSSISQASDDEVRQIGILCEHYHNLTQVDQMRFSKMVDGICEKYNKPAKQEVAKVVAIKPTIDKVSDESATIAEKIDEEIDNLFAMKSDGKFDPVVYLTNANLTSGVANRLSNYYVDTIKELHEVVSGKDEQLNEAYSHHPRPRVKRILHSFLIPMQEYLDNLVRVKKAERKPRTRKEKPASALVKAVQYQKEFKELNLKSIEPKQIIGASQVFLYNVKYKKLTHLVSTDAKGLTIKGTTIYGFNVDESMTKVVRKPDLVFAEINKRKLKFHMKQMKTTAQEANGRINSDTIILTV